MSWLSSVLTPPGENAAEGVEQNKQTAANYSQSDLAPWNSYLQGQIGFQQKQQSQAQNAVNQLGTFTTQGGRDQMVNAYNNWAQGTAANQATQSNAKFAGNPALGQAYGLDAMNRANQQTSQYAQKINSPEGEAQAYQSYLQGLQSQSPDFTGLSQLTGNVMGQPSPQVGQGLMSYLPTIASMASNFIP